MEKRIISPVKHQALSKQAQGSGILLMTINTTQKYTSETTAIESLLLMLYESQFRSMTWGRLEQLHIALPDWLPD